MSASFVNNSEVGGTEVSLYRWAHVFFIRPVIISLGTTESDVLMYNWRIFVSAHTH